MNDGPLSLGETRDLLDKLSHMPKKWLGQNFLVDGNIVRKSLELAEIKPGDCVLEVGPGLGTLSRTLLGAGAELHAVEADPHDGISFGRNIKIALAQNIFSNRR
jgi:16S rRNA (adenine1518-N6/adenine1519-N6)-dimethyltransferase